MLLGEYAYALDAKGRLFLPARLREELTANVVLSRGVDHCINVYSAESFGVFSDRLFALPEIEMRDVRRFVFSAAQETSPDAQGRVLLLPALREWAGLKKEVLILGVGDHAEIWDKETYEALASARDEEAMIRLLTEKEF
ncbi:MAG: division/cell wall cluster transcriptional repressor MraZ [Clostridia bacterium]|nr:division/cell wall cluster transcriptional repressor MraZ [Clostridia bacterium]